MANTTETKPTAAFALSLLAGLFTLFGAFLTNVLAPLIIQGVDRSTILVFSAIGGILVIVGSWLLYNDKAQRKLGSMLVIGFSVISFNFVGLILGLVGGFLGLTYEAPQSSTSSSRS